MVTLGLLLKMIDNEGVTDLKVDVKFHHSDFILDDETAREAEHSSHNHRFRFPAGSGKAILHQLTCSTSLEGFLHNLKGSF